LLFAGVTMTEPLFGTLLTLAVYLLVRDEGPVRTVSLVATAVVLAAATYVRPQAILLAPLLPLARATRLRPGFLGRIAGAALVTAITLACIAPWSVRNCRDLDGCAFVSTNGGSNFAIGAVARANGRFFFLDNRDGCAGVHGEVARDRCWRSVARASIERHPWRWLKLGLVKIDHTLSYEAFPVGYAREAWTARPPPGALASRAPPPSLRRILPLDDRLERIWRRTLSFPWRVLLALALLALVPVYTRRFDAPAARVSLVACIVMLATHAAFFGGDRYHLPLAPLVAVLAAGAFRRLPRVVRRASRSATVRAVRFRDLEAEFSRFASL
jgi:hypothetical protein